MSFVYLTNKVNPALGLSKGFCASKRLNELLLKCLKEQKLAVTGYTER